VTGPLLEVTGQVARRHGVATHTARQCADEARRLPLADGGAGAEVLDDDTATAGGERAESFVHTDYDAATMADLRPQRDVQ
jgi:hypothetical protein